VSYFENAARVCAEIEVKQESYSEGRNELLARIALLLAVACDELEGIRVAINGWKDDGK
jgi:hypothetical protein